MDLRLGSEITEPFENDGSSAQSLLLFDAIPTDPRAESPELLCKQRKQVGGVPYLSFAHYVNTELTPRKDKIIIHNMDDDVIRGATVTHQGAITYPPPPPKVQAIAAAKPKGKVRELTPEEKRAKEAAAFRSQTKTQVGLLVAGGLLIALVGAYAPASFMAHFIVFALACFVGFQVIWSVSHSLHTPLMAVTNAISGIVVLGALLQVGSSHWLVVSLASLSFLIATINIVGGFLVTRRMLAMFQKS
jgi:NAD(P) transhydrogenase subunit alpha